MSKEEETKSAQHAVKLLVSGHESSGKSTITSKLNNVLVINFDRKGYNFSVPHVNVPVFDGMDSMVNLLNTKIGAYKTKFGKLPDTVVFDTVTQLYTAIQKYCLDKWKGFDVHSNINKFTLGVNEYIEDTLIKNGVNVIIVAHTMYDSETARYIIPASGAFAKSGSWLSVVNNAMFIEKKSGKLIVHHRSMKLPSRTTLETQADNEPVESYDINNHIAQLTGTQEEAALFAL